MRLLAGRPGRPPAVPVASFEPRRPLPGGVFVVEATGPDLLAGPGPVRDAVAQVPVSWPLLLDLRAVSGRGPDPYACGILAAAGQRRLRAGTALAVVAGPQLLHALTRSGLSRLVLLHDSVDAAAEDLRSRRREDEPAPIAYRPRRSLPAR